MTATVPTTEPASVVAGDTLAWRITLADYPADVWTLKYRLINAGGKIDITAAASGTDHLVGVAAATSAAYAAGDYTWTAWAEKTLERVTVRSGNMTVLPNVAELLSLDGRSSAARIVAQLTAAYESYTVSNGHVSEYEIAGRRMKYRNGAEILEQLNFWEARVASEKRAERIAAGLGGGNKVLVRF
jgi:hypothetical protein